MEYTCGVCEVGTPPKWSILAEFVGALTSGVYWWSMSGWPPKWSILVYAAGLLLPGAC